MNPKAHTGQFLLGVNYWPSRKAMYWWQDFDPVEVEGDFRRIAAAGMRVVRFFLLWEEFQPEPGVVDKGALRDLVAVADLAGDCGISVMPTFFCGHMSGVNWMPGWVLGSRTGGGRFPVYSGGRLEYCQILNFYGVRELVAAQRLQCREVARALAGHEALWGYDLGNEPSNCVHPRDRQEARDWLDAVVGELKGVSEVPVTLGMHAEDLEEDRKLWPQDAALYCDFLCMHGYPFYLDWVNGPLDVGVLPFLGSITRWLGGKPVLFQEFGVSDQVLQQADGDGPYYREALALLYEAGMTGAFAWCYGDYHPELWERPPLNDNPHERYFGIFKDDGAPKAAVQEIKCFAAALAAGELDAPDPCYDDWLSGEDPERFYRDPKGELRRLYRRFCEVRRS